METGDLVCHPRVDVGASFRADHRSGVWINHLGLILSTGDRCSSGEYLVRVFFPDLRRVRTIRASKLVLQNRAG